jgi:hypothetical protein
LTPFGRWSKAYAAILLVLLAFVGHGLADRDCAACGFLSMLVRDDPTMWCAGLMLAALLLVLLCTYALRGVSPAEFAPPGMDGMRAHSVVASSRDPISA